MKHTHVDPAQELGRAIRVIGVAGNDAADAMKALNSAVIGMKDVEFVIAKQRPCQTFSVSQTAKQLHIGEAFPVSQMASERFYQGKFNALPEKSTFTPVRHSKSKRWV
jgi:hypothetical protein